MILTLLGSVNTMVKREWNYHHLFLSYISEKEDMFWSKSGGTPLNDFSDHFWDVLHWFSYTSYFQIPSSVEGTGLSWKVPSWNSHIYIRTTRIRDMNLVRVWFIFESLVLVPFWQKFRCTQCNLYSDPNQFYFLTNPNIHFYFQKRYMRDYSTQTV